MERGNEYLPIKKTEMTQSGVRNRETRSQMLIIFIKKLTLGIFHLKHHYCTVIEVYLNECF